MAQGIKAQAIKQKILAGAAAAAGLAGHAGCATREAGINSAPAYSSILDPAPKVHGEGIVRLKRVEADPGRLSFQQATIVPGRGFDVFQIEAMIPGRGMQPIIASPSLADAAIEFASEEDRFGNATFKHGGAILVPFANRIRGKLDVEGKTVKTKVAGRELSLPANWRGKSKNAEPHAVHGLILRSKAHITKLEQTDREASVEGVLAAGGFGAQWPSSVDVRFRASLRADVFRLQVEAKNVGREPTPIGIGWHPYFRIPSGDRTQAVLRVPAKKRALVNNYDDVFPTGKLEPVAGTRYDFARDGGRALGDAYLDDCFVELDRPTGSAVAEIVDRAAKFGLRIRALSPEIKAFQVYAPPDKAFIALEPQFNLADPFSKAWAKGVDTGMVTLNPGESVAWTVELELFEPDRA